jgi:adenosine deaminase
MEPSVVRSLPKAVLHDHLDGGLRVSTVLELADSVGYVGLPSADPQGLAAAFHQGGSGSLEEYLAAFEHTIAVMQTPEALERVAYEAVVDLAADGAVYAEVRFGPSLHRRRGLQREDAIESVLAGLGRAAKETGCVVGLVVTALRDAEDSDEVARAAARFAGAGVVGFDLAGPEAGYPADDHLPACRRAREAGLGLTIHAGEGDGPESIWRAVGRCSAQRLGHGVRIADDAKWEDGEIVALGPLAASVRDQQIPLELCITSNVHTGIAADATGHPFGALRAAGFAVTINTDNRLMSGTTLGDEYALAAANADLDLRGLGEIVERTIRSGFGDWEDRRRLIEDVVRPAYTAG